jgi:site-specific recombinase XerD
MIQPASLAPLLERFFTQRLMLQRQASAHTITSYRDTFRQFLKFAEKRLHKPPSRLNFEEIDAPLIVAFLDDLEKRRGISARSRNLRLTAIHSFFRFAAFEAPAHSAQIQRVLAIPSKRYTRTLVPFLTRAEVDALLLAPDRHTWSGRRDHAFMLVAVQTGLRLSEMTGLKRRGSCPRNRGALARDRQGPQGALHAIGQAYAGRLDRLVARATARRRASLVSQCQGRTPERSRCAVPAEQTSIDGIEHLSVAATETRYRPPLEAHHGHGPSAVRREALRDCPLARA